MARTPFQVEILTPEGEVFNEEVEMLSTRTAVGSLLRAAPMLETTGIPCDNAAHISDTLSRTESIASTITSGFGINNENALSLLMRTSIVSTLHAGAMS